MVIDSSTRSTSRASVLVPYEALSQQLEILDKAMRVIYSITPENLKSEREAFLANPDKAPDFRYRPLEFDPDQILESLKACDVPDTHGTLTRLLSYKRDRLFTLHALLCVRGNRDEMLEHCFNLYGSPSVYLVETANKLLKESVTSLEEPKDVSPEDVVTLFEESYREWGITDFAVELSDSRTSRVEPAHKRVLIGNRMMSESTARRLLYHETTHVVRAINGRKQPGCLGWLFGTGIPGYLASEEGLTGLVEFRLGLLDPQVERKLAGRVVAAHMLIEGCSFCEVYEALLAHGFTDDMAWRITYRVFRGGGFTKDFVYWEGRQLLRMFASQGEDIRRLFVGKIGVQHLDLVQELLDDGLLNTDFGVPSFLSEVLH